MAGYVGDARPERNVAVFEIRSQADRWNTTIGRLLNPALQRRLRRRPSAGKTPTVYATTVVEAISATCGSGSACRTTSPTTSSATARPSSPRALGFDVAVRDRRLRRLPAGGRGLSPMPGFPEVGDTVLLRNGCSRVKKADDPTVPTCLTHDNVLRFRGFDQVPGTDRFVRFPIPGRRE
jgi:hypothetical protein